jgi:caspase domain-containing protein
MKKIALLLIVCMAYTANAQKLITGKSKTNFKFKPTYERGIPPNLFVELNFEDDDGNGILENEESARMKLTIKNKGNGPAQGLYITVKDDVSDSEFNINDKIKIANIQAGKSAEVEIPIQAGFRVKTAEHKLEISVKEHFGYDMDPAYLILNTLEYQKPKLVFSGLEIIDYGEGTGAISSDGQLQAGELVKAKIVVQNIGQNISKNTKYRVYSSDENIYIDNGSGSLGNLAIGEVKEFWINLSPNKRVNTAGNLPVFLSLTGEKGFGDLKNYKLPITLNQKPPQTATLEVSADIESLKRKVVRFESKSNKFTAQIGRIKKIDQVAPAKTVRENSVAVIFGIENYDNLPPAPYAENDAELAKNYFKNRLGVNQVVVYNSDKASGLVFDDVFNPDYGELQKAIIKGKTDLFVFYSGHGLPDKKGENIYLFPSDGRVERMSVQGYSIDKFYTNLEKLGARSVTVFLDACFSGASRATENINTENLIAMKGVVIKPQYHQPWLNNKNFSVFTSSSGSQTSLGFEPSQSGLFTYYLCLGLQGDADADNDRKVTNRELKDYLVKNVEATSKKILGLQTPEFRGNEDMILTEY